MMNTFTSSLIVTGLMAGIAGGAAFLPKKEQPFLTVESVIQSGPDIVARRVIHSNGVADWRVVVFSKDSNQPVCWTRPGEKADEGWSVYRLSPLSEITMSLDEWAGDLGCYARLKVGSEYSEITTWTPRGPYEPIKYERSFTR